MSGLVIHSSVIPDEKFHTLPMVYSNLCYGIQIHSTGFACIPLPKADVSDPRSDLCCIAWLFTFLLLGGTSSERLKYYAAPHDT